MCAHPTSSEKAEAEELEQDSYIVGTYGNTGSSETYQQSRKYPCYV